MKWSNMFIPILAALIPSLIGLAEKLLPAPNSGGDKKNLVMGILHTLYQKFLKSHMPDVDGVDEEAIFCEICSYLIDFTVGLMNKKAA